MKNNKNLLYFHKMNSLGNDFMICIQEENKQIDFSKILNKLQYFGDRFYGIGFDQFILIKKNIDQSNKLFDFEMEIFNQDGSRSEICGNATRCCCFLINKINDFKYQNLKIKSGSQILSCSLEKNLVSVIFEKKPNRAKPSDFELQNLLKNSDFHAEIIKDDQFIIDFCFKGVPEKLRGFYVDIGNPHLVFFTNKLFDDNVMKEIGEILTKSKIFLNGINIGFCFPLSSKEAILRVFERGINNLTFACGSGASAAGFIGFQEKIFKDSIQKIYFLQNNKEISQNNSIEIEIKEKIKMTGGFNYVFFGYIDIN
jgi:diaminopimelate epimerase